MFDYESVFRKKQHYITIPQIPSKKLFINNRLLNKLINKQEPDWDIYITKYPRDHCVSCIILDFDDKDNTDNALKDAQKLKRRMSKFDMNVVIVKSGRKGYHAYLQIPPRNFTGGELAQVDFDSNVWFTSYVKNIIGLNSTLPRQTEYHTLDLINTNAGLGGNIRLIGSKHPHGSHCEIIDGEFIKDVVMNDYEWDCLISAKQHAIKDVSEYKKQASKKVNSNGFDPIRDNDLRDLLPEIFGLDVKKYNKGYVYARCPFHNDTHASLFIDKERYACNSCGERGNAWTLIKKGYLKLGDDVRV